MCVKDYKCCPAYRDFNVFGVPDVGCCFSQMKYCKDVPTCVFKTLIYCIKKQDFNALKGLIEV